MMMTMMMMIKQRVDIRALGSLMLEESGF